MSVKITLPTPAPEDDVFPWLYQCGSRRGGTQLHNAWFFSGPLAKGQCVYAIFGAPGDAVRTLNWDGFHRLTRDEIKTLGLEALVPPAKEVPPTEDFVVGRKATVPNYWIGERGTPFVLTSKHQAVALAGGRDGSCSVSPGGFVRSSEIPLKPLPKGTVIEITVE